MNRRPPPPFESLERENAELRARIAALTGEREAATADLNRRLKALRESEAKYRQLHETRLDAFVTVSMDGRIQEFNERFQRMVGHDPKELRTLTYRDLTPERWHAFEEDVIKFQVLGRGISDIYEKEYRRKDGTIFPVELRTILMRDPADNTPAGMAAVVRDITDRKRGEQALRESEEKFKTAFLTSVDACYIGTLVDGMLLEINAAFEELFGYSREESIGRTSRDLGLWVDYDDRLRMRDQLLSVGFVKEMDTRGRKKSGEVFACSISTTAFHMQDRHCVIGVVRDISERKRAEQVLLESRLALADSQESLLALINSTNDLIWSVDPNTFGLITFNNGLRDYFARRGINLRAGMTPADLLPTDFAERWRGYYSRALSDGPFVEQHVTASGIPVLLLSLNLVKRAGTVSAISVFGKDITDRIASEDALRRSETRFRTLIEDAPVAIRLTRDTRTVYANRQYLDLYGYDTVGELLGTPVVNQWALECRGDIIDRTNRFMAGLDVVLEYEGTALRKDGTRFPAHAAVGPVQLPDGPALIIYITDITGRKRAEEALKASEEQYRQLFDEMIAGLIVLDVVFDEAGTPVDYRFVGGNPAYEKLTGHSVAADIGKTRKEWAIGWPPEIEQRFFRVATTGVPIQYERFNESLGRYYDTRAFSPRRGQVALVFTDITERKAAETALRQTEERFRQVAESVSDFIWEVDAEGVYTYTNPAVERILGYRPDELIGKKHFYDLFEEHTREELRQAAFQMFATKQAFRAFPNTNVSKDGRLVHVETSGVPLLDEAGNLTGYRGADSDVTERWMNEQAVRDLTGRLINAQEAERSRLSRELHDDFSQRLALLAINLDILRQSPNAAEDFRASVHRIHAQVEALAKDVRQMSHDLHPARLEQLGLVSAVRGLCNDLRAAHPLAIQCNTRDVPRDVPNAAALCLYRVVQEALQNVIKHSGAATAIVELTGDAAELRLVVSDDGCGFDVAAAQRRDSLGLANMRERVRSISGRFTIDSVAGRGTRIEVQAPLTI